MPLASREMIKRLEAGEDPEKLEAELGDLGGEDGAGGEGDADLFASTVKKIKARLKVPLRDPKLYEMSELNSSCVYFANALSPLPITVGSCARHMWPFEKQKPNLAVIAKATAADFKSCRDVILKNYIETFTHFNIPLRERPISENTVLAVKAFQLCASSLAIGSRKYITSANAVEWADLFWAAVIGDQFEKGMLFIQRYSEPGVDLETALRRFDTDITESMTTDPNAAISRFYIGNLTQLLLFSAQAGVARAFGDNAFATKLEVAMKNIS